MEHSWIEQELLIRDWWPHARIPGRPHHSGESAVAAPAATAKGGGLSPPASVVA